MLKKISLLSSFILFSIILTACVNNPILSTHLKSESKSINQTAYTQSYEKLSQEIDTLSQRAASMPTSWFALELVAQQYLKRAKLSGDYQDYAQAEKYLSKALELSGIGGPHVTQAQLDFSLHRLDSVASNLLVAENALLVSDIDKAVYLGVRGDLDLYQGNYQEALENYQQALALHKDSTTLFRLAVYQWRMGDFEQAETYIDQATEFVYATSPRLTAFFHLHRGLFDLDRGRYAEALAHYQDANAAFDGWWLVKEHIAEIYVLQGKTEAAKNIYIEVLAETGSPEFMDAMAGIASSETEANVWMQKARAEYEKQLVQFPEASYGHALGHYLDVGDEPQKALELAKANYALRPYGESEVLLAQAYLQVGQIDSAKAIIDKTLASTWRSADVHATAADIFEGLGLRDLARAQRSLALTINPDSL